MLSKEIFVKAMKALQAMDEAEMTLDDTSNGAIRLFEWKPYSDLLATYIQVLEDAMGIETNDEYGSDISYFIYELDYGKKWTTDSITTSDGESIDISTAEKLYDYLISEN